ncbi:MAG: MBL fold metallo-hydrolase [Bacteroidales bacterium]|nr:MBL fold metallo-hydrolase [Bacteroidales bacterium]
MDSLDVKINDLRIKIFHFNFIQVNTYILYDEKKEAIIIDPGNYNALENCTLHDFIDNNGLMVKFAINTHPHIDHIFGNNFCQQTLRMPVLMHEAGTEIYGQADEYCATMPFQRPPFPAPDRLVKEGEVLTFGHQALRVIYTPGHCDGSICLYDEKNKLVFTGDLLFEESIGRTDLPSGSYEMILKSIHDKIMTLPDAVIVYSGHGDATTIGHERKHNPYL